METIETIEQTLDCWLEEYSSNKNLLTKLTIAKDEMYQNKKDDTRTILLKARDIKVLIRGLNRIIQSNKESIIDCSYKLTQWRKNKNEEIKKKL